MTTEQYSIGYEAGYQDGWNESQDAQNPQRTWVGLTNEEREQAEKREHEFVCGECVKCGASIEKRGWVGLTVDEVIGLMKQFPDFLTRDVARAIEAKLKEKNNG